MIYGAFEARWYVLENPIVCRDYIQWPETRMSHQLDITGSNIRHQYTKTRVLVVGHNGPSKMVDLRGSRGFLMNSTFYYIFWTYVDHYWVMVHVHSNNIFKSGSLIEIKCPSTTITPVGFRTIIKPFFTSCVFTKFVFDEYIGTRRIRYQGQVTTKFLTK